MRQEKKTKSRAIIVEKRDSILVVPRVNRERLCKKKKDQGDDFDFYTFAQLYHFVMPLSTGSCFDFNKSQLTKIS